MAINSFAQPFHISPNTPNLMARLTADERIAQMTFTSVYPHYVAKVTKKGRSIDELHQTICWLTGHSEAQLLEYTEHPTLFSDFFDQAPMNASERGVSGKVCGIDIDQIENPLSKKVRCLDKVIDELAKGWSLEKIFRS